MSPRRATLAVLVTALLGLTVLPGSASARGVFISGHDADYHAYLGPTPAGARKIVQSAIAFTTNGIANPRILLATDVRDPGSDTGNNGDSRQGMISSGFPNFTVADDGNGGQTDPSVLDLREVDFGDYDVVVVASDEGGWLRQSELDILNSRREDITTYVNGGGGLVVLPESGLRPGNTANTGTVHDRLQFLPVLIPASVHNQEESGFTATAFGQSLGLTDADVNGPGNFSHTIIDDPGPYSVVDRDPDGNAVSVAGKGPFCATSGGNKLSLTPPTQDVPAGSKGTVDGTLADPCGNPQSGQQVTYTVTSGPDQGATATPTTDAQGHTTFTVPCKSAGTDTVGASSGGVQATTVKVVCLPPAPATLTGRAYGLSAHVAPAGLGVLNILPTPSAGPVSTQLASTTNTPCLASIDGRLLFTTLITARTLCAKVTTALNPARSDSEATVQTLGVAAAVLTTINATAIKAESHTTCQGSTGATTFASLKIGSSALNLKPAPNTTLDLGIGKIVLNEQLAAPGELTVNAIHITVPILGTDVVVASAKSDIHNCPK
jgi:hypothetical protein